MSNADEIINKIEKTVIYVVFGITAFVLFVIGLVFLIVNFAQ